MSHMQLDNDALSTRLGFQNASWNGQKAPPSLRASRRANQRAERRDALSPGQGGDGRQRLAWLSADSVYCGLISRLP